MSELKDTCCFGMMKSGIGEKTSGNGGIGSFPVTSRTVVYAVGSGTVAEALICREKLGFEDHCCSAGIAVIGLAV